jgi:excisionase family DNA binding protein
MSQRIIERSGVNEKQARRAGRLMTPEQCAAFLQIEVNTLYVMKSQRRIPYRKVGHLLRFDFDEIVEWTKPKEKSL